MQYHKEEENPKLFSHSFSLENTLTLNPTAHVGVPHTLLCGGTFVGEV